MIYLLAFTPYNGRSGVILWTVLFCVFLMSSAAHSNEPLIIAHRGASEVAPENTRSALLAAIEMGATVIEFDVRQTKDRVLVLFHDADLRRITGRKSSIESLTWEEVSKLDVGSWFEGDAFAGETPLLLSDAITLCLEAKVTPLIEHKSGDPQVYLDTIAEIDALDRVVVQSFDWKFLSALHAGQPSLRIGALGKRKLDSDKREALSALKPQWVGWKYSDLSQSSFDWLKAKGHKIALWTINDPDTAKHWADTGADGIITDCPDRIAAALQENR